jgi:DNA-binding CsgD family transcriptional regulator
VSAEVGLLEREGELARLTELVQDAVRGRGRLVLIEGPAGIGKTRLLEAARARAAREGAVVHAARGGDLERELPFGVVRQLFEPSLRRADSAERETLLQGPAALAEPMLLDEDAAGRPSEGDRQGAMLHGLYWLTSNLAERAPLLLAIDDAHWADVPSLTFLHYLARRVEDIPVLLLAALRPAEPEARDALVTRLRADPGAVVLRPAPLSASGVADLVRSTLPARADDAFCGACHRATGGNPFLVGELVRALGRDGVAPTSAAADSVAALVPDAVRRQVLARLVRLPVEARELAQSVAVLGTDVALRHAARLAGLDDATAARAADALVAADLLHHDSPLEFAHPLVREAVYADVPPVERGLRHRRAAELLAEADVDRDRVAAQLLACEPEGSGWAVEVLRNAAERALGAGAPSVAAAYLRRALAEPPSPGERPGLVHALGLAEMAEGDPAGIAHLEEALEGAAPGRPFAAVARALAYAYTHLARYEAAVEVLDRAIAQLDEGDREQALQLEAEAATPGRLTPATAARTAERMRRFEGQIRGETPAERLLLANLGFQRLLEGASAAEALPLALRALDCGLLDEQPPEASTIFDALYVLLVAEEFARLDRACGELIRRGHARGSRWAVAGGSCFKAHMEYRRGAIATAESDALVAIQAFGEQEVAMMMATPALIDALVERGELAAAEEALTAAGGDDIPDRFVHNMLLEARGRLRIAAGDDETGVKDLLELGRREQRWRAGNAAALAYRSAAAIGLARLGETVEARRLVDEELALATAWGTPRAIGIALRARGVIAEDGLEDLQRAVDVLEYSGARLELARALTDLGAAQRRAGRRGEARTQLRRGFELARECAATALQERARRELAAAGARLRRDAAGADVLTPSERRVAAMAAEGLSNREIAQALFLSLKTVEMHLSRTYRKLGVGARAELAGALSAAPASASVS